MTDIGVDNRLVVEAANLVDEDVTGADLDGIDAARAILPAVGSESAGGE